MSGTRALGPFSVFPVGLGGMYLSIHDRPSEAQAIATVAAAIEAGVTLIDTADVYCLDHRDIGHNERLIAKALAGRKEKVIVATKGGLERPKGAWTRNAKPAHLRDACEASLKALGVDAIDVYQLHAPDPDVPFADSVGALAELRKEGKVKHVGLSNVSVAEIETALGIVPIVSVQNRWNTRDRSPEKDGVLAACEKHSIAFLPYSPFGGATGARGLADVGSLDVQAKQRGISAHRLIIAWMLAKSPVVIPIPGARRPASITDSAAATSLALSPADIEAIERSFTN
jgi:aryl-alcohol dehydrogenase-like predicted oxidoreductase